MTLRPLTPDGSRRKRDEELSQSENHGLRRQREKAEWLKRNGRGTERGRR